MSTLPHVIGRQQLQLRLAAGRAVPHEVQRLAEQTLQSPALLAALDAVLTAACPPTEWLTIERLELPLGAVASAELEPALRRLPELLRGRLAEAAAHATVTSSAATHDADEFFAAPLGLLPVRQSVVAHRATTPATAWAAWLHFLRCGTLPYQWPTPAGLAAWEAQLLPLLATATEAQRQQLLVALQATPVRQRLARQFSAAVAAAVLGVLVPAVMPLQAALAAGLAPLLQAGPTADIGEALVQELLAGAATGAPVAWPAVAAALTWPAGDKPVAPVRQLVAPVLAALPALTEPRLQALAASRVAPAGPAADTGKPGLPAAALAPALPPPATASPQSARAEPGAEPGAILAGAGLSSSSIPSGPASAAEAPLPPPWAAPEPEAAFVAYAGMVLLHPFLSAAFAACGWLTTDGQTFRTPTDRQRAVLLLHWLATGRSTAAEYELELPRLLCAVPADEPLRARLRLGRAARIEGLALLQAALGHWSALKNTTPDGLRTAFLQREGKLEQPAFGPPQLTVAPLAQDVLLERLPYGWGLSLMHLPWMPQHLLIQWA